MNDDALKGLLGKLRNGQWLDAQSFPDPAYAVPGLIPEGFGLFVGAPKIGKSWAVLSIALAVSGGGIVFGQVDVGPARPVLYLALEDGDRRLQSRSRQLLGGDPIPPLFTYETQLDPESTVPLIEAWLALHAGRRPLVIVDTLGVVKPPAKVGESAYAHDYRVGRRFKRLADDAPGSTVLVVHHDRKAATDDFVDSVSGTNGLSGSSDFLVVLERKRQESNGVMKVTGREVREGEYGVTIDNYGRWTLLGNNLVMAAAAASEVRATAGLGSNSAEVVRFVNQYPAGVRAAEVAAAVGIPAKELTVYLGRLATSGKIARLDRGLYGPPVVGVGSVASTPESEPAPPANPVGSVVTTPLLPTLTTQPTGGERENNNTGPKCLRRECKRRAVGNEPLCWNHLDEPGRLRARAVA